MCGQCCGCVDMITLATPMELDTTSAVEANPFTQLGNEIKELCLKMEIDTAKQRIETAISQNPSAIEPLLLYHSFLVYKGNYKAAAELLHRILNQRRDEMLVHLRIFELLLPRLAALALPLPCSHYKHVLSTLQSQHVTITYSLPSFDGEEQIDLFSYYAPSTAESIATTCAQHFLSHSLELACAIYILLAQDFGREHSPHWWLRSAEILLKCGQQKDAEKYQRYFVSHCLPNIFSERTLIEATATTYPDNIFSADLLATTPSLSSYSYLIGLVVYALQSMFAAQQWSFAYRVLRTIAATTKWRSLFERLQDGHVLSEDACMRALHSLSEIPAKHGTSRAELHQFEIDNFVGFCLLMTIFFHGAQEYYNTTTARGDFTQMLIVLPATTPPSTAVVSRKRRRTEDAAIASNSSTTELMDIASSIEQSGGSPAEVARYRKALQELQLVRTALALLQSAGHPMIQSRFAQLSDAWETAKWDWLALVLADAAIYEASLLNDKALLHDAIHKCDVVRTLYSLGSASVGSQTASPLLRYFRELCVCRFGLQAGIVSFTVGDIAAARRYLLQILTSMPIRTTNTANTDDGDVLERSFEGPRLANFTEATLQSQAIGYLVACCERRGDVPGMLVLIQHGWPRHVAKFRELIKQLKAAGGELRFPEFFRYIVNIDMLEEFLYLANHPQVANGVKWYVIPEQKEADTGTSAATFADLIQRHVVASASTPELSLTNVLASYFHEEWGKLNK